MSASFRRQLADYVEYHRDPWNCAMHVFGILFLFLAAVLPLNAGRSQYLAFKVMWQPSWWCPC